MVEDPVTSKAVRALFREYIDAEAWNNRDHNFTFTFRTSQRQHGYPSSIAIRATFQTRYFNNLEWGLLHIKLSMCLYY